jgi:ABC-2 type transport system permease protein
MKNILVILKKEYLTRIKNKSFIIMTFVGPILMVAFYAGAIYFATQGAEDNRTQTIYLTSKRDYVRPSESTFTFDKFLFIKTDQPRDTILASIKNETADAWLNIQDLDLRTLDSSELISNGALSLSQNSALEGFIKDEIRQKILQNQGINKATLDSAEVLGGINKLEVADSGNTESSATGIKSGIGFAMALIIYMFIFIYGSMVMRSAMEEKTNRIVEVIVSSVKPFELMMGKILGVALVGLTQFLAWIILSVALISGASTVLKIGANSIPAGVNTPTGMTPPAGLSAPSGGLELISQLNSLPYWEIGIIFILFFLGGYLLYSSIFAAIGSAVNQDTDVQQFMMPVSLPLVFGFIIAQSVVFQAPHGKLAKIFSMIPLTSPVVMAVRAPFGVPISEIIASFTLLALTFILMVWLSAKIYRIGILSYGKKPTWKDFVKWIRQS